MLRYTLRWLAVSPAILRSSLSPLEVFTQLQLGITPPLSVQRSFLLEHCAHELEERGVTEAKLVAMDGRLCAQLLKQLVFARYLSVPFRVFCFDVEFTGSPVFTADGPTEDITELGLYSPARDACFSCLVRPPRQRRQSPEVEALTQISDALLEKEGLPFPTAWRRFMQFIQTPEDGERAGAADRLLLLSHGGKLADVSMIKWTLERYGLELPSSLIFGDTIHLIRDAHRRRPVTVDRHPPSWKLLDLVQWLKIPPTLPAHRAANDARMTWDALHHTLLRYGDDELAPRDQLVLRFFDEEAKNQMRLAQRHHTNARDTFGGDAVEEADAAVRAGSRASDVSLAGSGSEEGRMADSLQIDFDDIFGAAEKAVHRAGDASNASAADAPTLPEVVLGTAATATATSERRGQPQYRAAGEEDKRASVASARGVKRGGSGSRLPSSRRSTSPGGAALSAVGVGSEGSHGQREDPAAAILTTQMLA